MSVRNQILPAPGINPSSTDFLASYMTHDNLFMPTLMPYPLPFSMNPGTSLNTCHDFHSVPLKSCLVRTLSSLPVVELLHLSSKNSTTRLQSHPR